MKMQRLTTPLKLDSWKARLLDYRFLPLILVLSLTLNLWGNRWGAPNLWHPDEVIGRAISMVSQRTFNPHYFPYGGLHYSLVAVGAIIPVAVYERTFDPKPSRLDVVGHAQWEERHLVRVIQMARSISAVMSALVVGITCIIGALLFDRRVGHLAALFLAVSMSFVAIAHFATVDAPANFWYWLSCLFALGIWKRGDRIWYILAAVTAGLAIGTKIDRVIILFPLLFSHLLRSEGLRFRRLLACVILISTSFVLANPTLILAFFEFLDGFTRDLYFNSLRGEPGLTSYTRLLRYTKSGLGLPLFVLGQLGIACGLYDLAQRKNPRRIAWLLASLVPYYALYGLQLIRPAYCPVFLPSLMILAAYACVNMVMALPQRYTFMARSVVALIAAYSFFHTIALILQFSNDSRYRAAEWIEKHVPANATIQMFRQARGPVISKETYRIIDSPLDKEVYVDAMSTRDRLVRNRAYQELRRVILDLEKWTGRYLGFPVREQPYVAWFDRAAALYEKPSIEPLGIVGVQINKPDYVVLIEHSQGKNRRKTWSALHLPSSGYRPVAEFRFSNRFGIQPFFSPVNPWVYIFQREGSQPRPQSKLQSDPKLPPDPVSRLPQLCGGHLSGGGRLAPGGEAKPVPR